MGKRKRTWSDNYQSCSKRYRKEEFTNFRQFIHEAPDALRQSKIQSVSAVIGNYWQYYSHALKKRQ